MATTRTESIAAPDGGSYDATLVLPDDGAGNGGAVLLIQEIFGVNEFVVSKAHDLAGLGYAVLCPDVFWRVERNVALAHDDESLQRAFGYMTKFSEIGVDTARDDLLAALAHLRTLPAVTGKVAVMGYCLGGWLAFETAAAGDPDACVSYYGAQIPDRLGEAEHITCPTLFHFGDSDPFLPMEGVDRIREAVEDRPGFEVHVQPGAGHAFENFLAAQFHDPDAAARSWPITVDFLARTLP